jgi:hypothetical protein
MEWEDIKSIVPDESAAFERQLEAAGVDMDAFCCAMAIDDLDGLDVPTEDDDAVRQTIEGIEAAWKNLAGSFTRVTTVEGKGLELQPCYRDAEYGDRDDEVEGDFFHVSGAYQLSPAGKKYADKIRR